MIVRNASRHWEGNDDLTRISQQKDATLVMTGVYDKNPYREWVSPVHLAF